MTTQTAALITRSGLTESPPALLGALCELARQVLGDPEASVEVVLMGVGGPVRVAGVGAVPAEAVQGEGAHEVPLATDDGVELGHLRVFSTRTPGAELDTVVAAVVTACELELTRTRLFDAEEEVARAAEQFTAAAGQVVHDLNNPLAAAAMSLEIAREQVDEGLVAQLLDRAVGSAEKMKRMTTNLLTFVHEPRQGRADVGEVLARLTAEFEGLPVSAVSVAGELPVVAMSPGDLEVVLVALLDNAVKFAAEERDPQVSVRAEQVGERWRVVVADNGRGISAEDLGRIFEPTVRLDRRIPGMGLGLATVRRLVHSAGGEVGAVSTPGAGTEVWFELPV